MPIPPIYIVRSQEILCSEQTAQEARCKAGYLEQGSWASYSTPAPWQESSHRQYTHSRAPVRLCAETDGGPHSPVDCGLQICDLE